jgi:selenophosphate synthetase-related protein
VRGHPDNPLSWDEIHAKFKGLVEPKLGMKTEELFEAARDFGAPGSMARVSALLEGDR